MTENTRWTPGPWTIHSKLTERNGTQMGYIEIKTPDGLAICTVFPFAGNGGVGLDAGMANARLISASQSLYEALKWYVDNDDMLDPDANPWHYEGQQRAIAALKKARGEL